jgi:hypothetical protein
MDLVGAAPTLSFLLPRLDSRLRIEILQAIPTETTIFVVPLIGLLALGLVIMGFIVFLILRRRGTGSLGQDDSWLQE